MSEQEKEQNFCPKCVKVLAYFATIQATDIQWTLYRVMTESNPEEVISILGDLVGKSIEGMLQRSPLKMDRNKHLIDKTGKRFCQKENTYEDALRYFARAEASRFKGLDPAKLKRAFQRIYPIKEKEIADVWHAMIDTKDSKSKGEALEKLCFLLFSSVKGFRAFSSIRTKTEEIDIVIQNGSKDPFWEKFGPFILVECKNWSSKCRKDDIVIFKNKMENRFGFCKVGFLISLGGFATTVTKEILRSSKGGPVIGLLKQADLEELIASKHRSGLLKEKLQAAIFT